MLPADVVSLESSDNHHHPNSQLIFAQLAQDRKTTKKGGKTNGSKDFGTKKTPTLKKSKNNIEGRASSKGAVQGNARHEMQKRTH